MNTPELIAFWTATLALAASFLSGALGWVLARPRWLRLSRYGVLAAFILLTVFGVVRWTRVGHPPFVSIFESMLTTIWFTLGIALVVVVRTSLRAAILLPVSLVSFLLMGWASDLSSEASELSAALDNVWLFIHASFATAGAAALLIAASLSVVYLAGNRGPKFSGRLKEAIPERENLPRVVLHYLFLGLILWGVMIVSGAIWAHVAWGRFWAWDPIEVWSLISWLLYGLVLHARLTFGVKARTFCILTIVAALTTVFSLWGVQYLYETVHTYG